jgi:hypothetical protein
MLKVGKEEIKYQKGDIIRFGGYDWRVLDVQNNEALIISDRIAGKRAYNDFYRDDVTWETCEMRKHLNSAFFGKFNEEEMCRIVEKKVATPSNQWYRSSGGNDTHDKVFLLSLEEVVRYFGDSGDLRNHKRWTVEDGQIVRSEAGESLEDDFDSARAAREANGTDLAHWWLRTPGNNNGAAVIVLDRGAILVYGHSISDRIKDNVGIVKTMDAGRNAADGVGFRPAMWLDLRPIKAVETAKKSKDDKTKEALQKSFAPLLEKYDENAQAARKALVKQSEEWKSKGLCVHCGSDKIGLFGKCKSCKKSAKKPIEPDLGVEAYVGDDLWVHVRFAESDWLALAVRDGKTLLVSDRIIGDWTYQHYPPDAVNWERSAVRKNLNSFLVYDRFNKRDKARVAPTTNNTNNTWTTDYVFLLSIEEMREFFWNSESDLQNHSRSIAKDMSGKACSWWLRTMIDINRKVACVNTDGSLISGGSYYDSKYGVRPALWLKL